jgi:glycerol transport system permease protein
MDKTINQKAWFLVLPVFLVVAFSAILPLMTVVNYSMQDTFGNNQFFWNGVGWFKELLDPSTDLGGRFLDSLGRNLFFSAVFCNLQRARDRLSDLVGVKNHSAFLMPSRAARRLDQARFTA